MGKSTKITAERHDKIGYIQEQIEQLFTDHKITDTEKIICISFILLDMTKED